MKIIAVSNFDNETVSDELVAENIQNENHAKVMVEALNQKYSGDHALKYFKVKPDEYVLYRWEP